jgi:hypothetical protein
MAAAHPGGGPHQQQQQHHAVAAAVKLDEPQGVSSFNFPPGLIPQLVKEKSKWAEAYAPIPADEIERAGLPPMPEKDSYLSHRCVGGPSSAIHSRACVRF